jgi:hypothetical protein
MTKQQRRTSKAKLFIATISILLIISAGVIWILNSEHIIGGDWANILSIIFIVLAVLVPLIQWVSPLFSKEPEPPLSSNLTLIDAALDPHDSPYEQSTENGRKIIRYKGEKPRRVDKQN